MDPNVTIWANVFVLLVAVGVFFYASLWRYMD